MHSEIRGGIMMQPAPDKPIQLVIEVTVGRQVDRDDQRPRHSLRGAVFQRIWQRGRAAVDKCACRQPMRAILTQRRNETGQLLVGALL